MGAIAHYLESAGIPTTGISLVRENTVLIRPPRALWTPFELGRPFGAPHAPAFQTKVLTMALALLERKDGPVILEDFPEDAPKSAAADNDEPLACPVSFPAPAGPDDTDIVKRVLSEIASLAPWHALFVENRGRTSANTSGMAINAATRFIGAFVEGETPPLSPAHTDLAAQLRAATEDLKNWHIEAVTAQPGQEPTSHALADWFWGETSAGALLLALHPACQENHDLRIRHVLESQLVPRLQQHRLARP